MLEPSPSSSIAVDQRTRLGPPRSRRRIKRRLAARAARLKQGGHLDLQAPPIEIGQLQRTVRCGHTTCIQEEGQHQQRQREARRPTCRFHSLVQCRHLLPLSHAQGHSSPRQPRFRPLGRHPKNPVRPGTTRPLALPGLNPAPSWLAKFDGVGLGVVAPGDRDCDIGKDARGRVDLVAVVLVSASPGVMVTVASVFAAVAAKSPSRYQTSGPPGIRSARARTRIGCHRGRFRRLRYTCRP